MSGATALELFFAKLTAEIMQDHIATGLVGRNKQSELRQITTPETLRSHSIVAAPWTVAEHIP